MPPILPVSAVIELSFPGVPSIGGVGIRLETVALGAVLLVGLLLAGLIAWRSPAAGGRLRVGHLLVLAVAAIPGAVAGGRVGYGLLHLDVFGADPGRLLDPGVGGLQLSLAVVGGTLTAALATWVVGAPIGRWLHAAALPLLLAIAGGKLAMALGGEGQGIPFDGSWATAYAGSGPWGSLAPAIPSHPAQLYEAIVAAGVLVVLGGVLAVGAFRRRSGGAFAAAVGLWAIGRAVVATTWRDAAVLGPLLMDQLISILIAAVALAWLVLDARRPGAPLPEDATRR